MKGMMVEDVELAIPAREADHRMTEGEVLGPAKTRTGGVSSLRGRHAHKHVPPSVASAGLRARTSTGSSADTTVPLRSAPTKGGGP